MRSPEVVRKKKLKLLFGDHLGKRECIFKQNTLVREFADGLGEASVGGKQWKQSVSRFLATVFQYRSHILFLFLIRIYIAPLEI